MALLYDRKETQDEIIIVFKYFAAWYIIVIAFFLSFFIEDQKWYFLLFLLLVFIAIVSIKPNREIKRAMKTGKVEISGSKFSFKNPPTYRIKK